MPPVPYGSEYLLEVLFECGPVKQSMSGAVAIDDVDLMAWQNNQAIDLSGWACKTIRNLSHVYADTLRQAISPLFPPPYIPQLDISPEKRENIAKGLLSWVDKINKVKMR